MKKIIATLTTTLLLTLGVLSGGALVAAPANAEDCSAAACPPPVECEPYIQPWRDRALVAEADRDRFYDKMMLTQGYFALALKDIASQKATITDLRSELVTAKAATDAATAKAATAWTVAERRAEKIKALRAKIRDLRQR